MLNDLLFIGIEKGALLENIFNNVFAFSEYLSKAWDRMIYDG